MTDVELTKRCAEAMGMMVSREQPGMLSGVWLLDGTLYDPLNFDSQAMALVKKFRLRIGFASAVDWLVEGEMGSSRWPDLNRAICECVAQLKPL